MLLRHATQASYRDVELSVTDRDATVADLITALDRSHRIGPVHVDDRRVSPTTPLDRAGITNGCVVRLGDHGAEPDRAAGSETAPGPPVEPGARLTFVVGPESGRTVVLPEGRHLVGRRGPSVAVRVDDPTVSASHAWIHVGRVGDAVGDNSATGVRATEVRVTDAGSTNGTWVDDRAVDGTEPLAPGAALRLGASVAVVEARAWAPPAADKQPRVRPAIGHTTAPLHRRGREPLAPPPAPVVLPPPEPPAPAVTPVGVIAIVVSVLGAGVLVAVLGSWTYAAFAVIGPLMMLANTLDSRHRRRRGRRRYARTLRRELTRLEQELAAAAHEERVRRTHRSPGVPAAVDLAAAGVGCWERRRTDHDAFHVRVGHGIAHWDPVCQGDLTSAADEVVAMVDAHRRLEQAALGLVLAAGAPVAVVGPPDVARALVRSVVVQAATQHGPADLGVVALVSSDAAPAWDWLAWLPHAVDATGRRTLATSGAGADELCARLADRRCDADQDAPGDGGVRAEPLHVVVLDDPAELAARRSAARALLRSSQDPAASMACLVVLGPDDPVPATCRTVLRVHADGRLEAPPEVAAGPAVVCGAPLDVAADVARRLARFDDPELDHHGRGLPAQVRLRSVLELETIDPHAIAARWEAAGPDPAPVSALGTTADGPLVLDLAVDGPHALIAGTTGSGKSELLRSLVMGLACTNSPDHLTFLLVDFKGGSAFDACERLPHTVGLVTDLDDHLAARALRCLEAELRHREERLRRLGATDLTELRRVDPDGRPMPRLVVVIDEFAALANALPDFMASLVDVAQRGRSLGVHLVLATQRPAGAVSQAIRTNVNLRICLRVSSAQDSAEVIDSPLAATLPRRAPGRALVRLGPGELVAAQVASATLPSADHDLAVEALALGIDRAPATEPSAATTDRGAGPATDLSRLVSAMSRAWRSLERPAPRRPWPAPLPGVVPWPVRGADGAGTATGEAAASGEALAGGEALTLGWVDEPDRQRVSSFSWRPDLGPLLGVGLQGSGPRTLASTVTLAAADQWGSACHIHVIDGGTGTLLPLAGLAPVGAVVTAPQIERQRRLVEALAEELARRRDGRSTGARRRLLVVHGVTGLQQRWEESGHDRLWGQLLELVAEGTAAGMHVCCTAETSSVPHRLVGACEQRIVFRLGDRGDHAAFGIPTRAVPDLVTDRGLVPLGSGDAALVQVARPTDGVAAAVARLSAHHHAPDPADEPGFVGVLPQCVTAAELTRRADLPTAGSGRLAGGLVLPVGVADQGLQVAELELAPGSHGLIAGPPRSGRTTAVATLAVAAGAHHPEVHVVVVGAATDELPPTVEVVDAGSARLAELAGHPGPLLVLVDDADLTADDHGALTRLVAERRPDRHVVAAGRNDRLRSRYGHWTREVRADGVGLLLVPDADLDGDLLGVRLPRRAPVGMHPGRAWLAGTGTGSGGYVQVATSLPSARDRAGR